VDHSEKKPAGAKASASEERADTKREEKKEEDDEEEEEGGSSVPMTIDVSDVKSFVMSKFLACACLCIHMSICPFMNACARLRMHVHVCEGLRHVKALVMNEFLARAYLCIHVHIYASMCIFMHPCAYLCMRHMFAKKHMRVCQCMCHVKLRGMYALYVHVQMYACHACVM
jgi:hypothetical protein